MKRFLIAVLCLISLTLRAQITNYFDYIRSSNVTVTAQWLFSPGVVTTNILDGNGLFVSAPIRPVITMNQYGFGAHNPFGPGNLWFGDGVLTFPNIYYGFFMDSGLYLTATPESLRTAGSITNESHLKITKGPTFFHAGGLSVTQSVMLVNGGFTNVWTNAYIEGLLIASGPVIIPHGPSWVWPLGGYILWPSGGTILLP